MWNFENLNISENNPKKPNIKELFENINIEKKEKKYEKYVDKLEQEGFSEETEKLILKWILDKLENKIVTIDWIKIKFDEVFIYNNIEQITENIKNFLIYLMNIESYWWKNVENKESSAKWPLQWIDGWKNWIKHSNYNRKEWIFSPFETALRRADLFYSWNKYPSFKSEKIPKHIIEAWNNWWKLDVKKFDSEKQIQLWFIDILTRKWKAIEYLMWTMLWNTWSANKLYMEIHHTKTSWVEETKKAVKKHYIHLSKI
jgi:hypothetical protein